jgi:hypothetical protein
MVSSQSHIDTSKLDKLLSEARGIFIDRDMATSKIDAQIAKLEAKKKALSAPYDAKLEKIRLSVLEFMNKFGIYETYIQPNLEIKAAYRNGYTAISWDNDGLSQIEKVRPKVWAIISKYRNTKEVKSSVKIERL